MRPATRPRCPSAPSLGPPRWLRLTAHRDRRGHHRRRPWHRARWRRAAAASCGGQPSQPRICLAGSFEVVVGREKLCAFARARPSSRTERQALSSGAGRSRSGRLEGSAEPSIARSSAPCAVDGRERTRGSADRLASIALRSPDRGVPSGRQHLDDRCPVRPRTHEQLNRRPVASRRIVRQRIGHLRQRSIARLFGRQSRRRRREDAIPFQVPHQSSRLGVGRRRNHCGASADKRASSHATGCTGPVVSDASTTPESRARRPHDSNEPMPAACRRVRRSWCSTASSAVHRRRVVNLLRLASAFTTAGVVLSPVERSTSVRRAERDQCLDRHVGMSRSASQSAEGWRRGVDGAQTSTR